VEIAEVVKVEAAGARIVIGSRGERVKQVSRN